MQADSESLPFADGAFDAVTVAFGVRNFEHLAVGVKDMVRVLRPGGRLFVLEFSKPHKTPFKQLFRLYFHRVMPTVGKADQQGQRRLHLPPTKRRRLPGRSCVRAGDARCRACRGPLLPAHRRHRHTLPGGADRPRLYRPLHSLNTSMRTNRNLGKALLATSFWGFAEAHMPRIKTENLPNFDLHVFHFGFLLSYNTSDFFVKLKPNAPFTDSLLVVDHVKVPGFNLGIVSSLNMTPNLSLRFLLLPLLQDRQLKYSFL